MKELTDILHLLLCNKTHSYEMLEITSRDPNVCYYYLEEDVADGQKMEDHLLWKSNASNFKRLLNFNSDEEVLNFIREVLITIQRLKELISGDENRSNFIKSIID